ncbi:hypothetical protein C8K38_101131 [Rhodococcus sp. OK611]|uniref:hypothetical protein n=1 Tax=unclassified Rhodococcus (in: high G+C Gram-positive bacteria) TaxID=192944 RepID=UPI000BD29832|nr:MULTISPECIES: hypothetical protein [unclassified Rhodococcus (in: high G+C Gram-positive bacteria)]PTR45404.1 hypothetical protein C8K38_101131 [Rhodococcus sp. OK611]SNX88954.1 hypothetical protein SAMN05447004_101131 [Rhodococcus sp. OK270]
MEPVDCERCGNRVLVEKNSWEHTTVQWSTDHPEVICEEYRDDPTLTLRGARVGRCPALRESIVAAAVDGRIAVPD